MILPGLCSVCGAPAMNTCKMCGKLVCGMHYEVSTGVCTACLGVTARGKRGR